MANPKVRPETKVHLECKNTGCDAKETITLADFPTSPESKFYFAPTIYCAKCFGLISFCIMEEDL